MKALKRLSNILHGFVFRLRKKNEKQNPVPEDFDDIERSSGMKRDFDEVMELYLEKKAEYPQVDKETVLDVAKYVYSKHVEFRNQQRLKEIEHRFSRRLQVYVVLGLVVFAMVRPDIEAILKQLEEILLNLFRGH
ncbi:hypothetical protein [Thermoflavimicrobium dichotomicum]|uniref:Uncharacterized protein n=1 Tax=Thermoflavimicrobium dichotomicum TaxID=46223 RepID=A0A1I3K688_9BACL|nr:hypothetical protein [Thermoflavimicrobium dichotomicum]SFI67997.1 hypothetical protein SAMN05421852_101349 [Thermoflavimicrobium dichotomicum]